MRTTLSIDDSLLKRAKKRAAERGLTLGRYVDEALREYLAARPTSGASVDLPVVSGGGLRPGVSLSSNREIYDLLDEDGPPYR